MNEKNYLWLKILNICVLSLSAVFACINYVLISALSKAPVMYFVSYAFLAAAIVFAALYIFGGYKKSSALYYKLFMGAFFICLVCKLIYFLIISKAAASDIPFVISVSCALSIITSLALAVTKDAGRITSYICAGVLLASRVGLYIYLAASFTSGLELTLFTSGSITEIILALNVLCFVVGKYRDKAARNTV